MSARILACMVFCHLAVDRGDWANQAVAESVAPMRCRMIPGRNPGESMRSASRPFAAEGSDGSARRRP